MHSDTLAASTLTVATMRDWLRFYETHGRAPFPFAAGAGDDDGNPPGGNENTSQNNGNPGGAENIDLDTFIDGEERAISLEAAKKLRSEAKGLRARMKTAESAAESVKALTTERDALKAQVDTLTKGGDKALQTLTAERDDWKGKYEALTGSLRAERLTGRATEEAAKLGAIDAAAVARLINAADIEWDDDNAPKAVDKAVEKLKAQFPKLFGATNARGNAGSRDERAQQDIGTGVSRLAHAYNQTQ